MNQILDGIRVLDLTNMFSGPFASQHLALMGAEVIKIENPKGGDHARKFGCLPEFNQKLMGVSFLAQNANKKSVTLNLKSESGKAIFKKLVETADVVLENFRPGVMKRLGLDYEVLSKIKPNLIYCAISGFGQTGPDAQKPAYDQIIQGLSGIMAITGSQEINPLRVGFPVCDGVSGLNAAFAVMSALFYREKTGEGQSIDIALIDSVMPMMGWLAANQRIGGQTPQPLGNNNFVSAPSGTFKTADGHINVTANTQEQWISLCNLLNISELINDARFINQDTRKENRNELNSIIERILQTNNSEYWIKILNSEGIPTGEILSFDAALNTPQIRWRDTFSTVNSAVGEIDVFNLTPKFSKTPGLVQTPPPTLSEHTVTILRQIGYTDSEIEQFRTNNII